MPYEVECGECHKQILIEDLGVEVACPYCQTTLILTEEDLASREEEANWAEDSHVVTSEEASFDFNFSEGSSSVVSNGGSSDSHLGGSGVSSAVMDEPPPESQVEEEPPEDSAPDFSFLKTPGEDATLDSDEPETREDIPNFGITDSQATATETDQSESAASADDVPNFNFDDPGDQETADVATISIDTTPPPPTKGSRDQEAADDQTKAKKGKRKGKKPTAVEEDATPVASAYARRTQSYPPRLVHFLISYSILLTIAFLYLLMNYFGAKPHQLESLPDIAPAKEGEFRLIRENADLAPGHTLQIGESQRFGNILITPLKVTRAPLRFEHFQHTRLGATLPPTLPVLKLWLEIKNVSDDEVFPPLDMEMLTKRVQDEEDYELVHAHNWVCRKEDLGKRSNRILMFNHPATSEYDIKGLITRPLKPGETMKTFLPTQEEELGRLTGPLVWRFQIRKGFNPQTMHGVTTLVDVKFSADDVKNEST